MIREVNLFFIFMVNFWFFLIFFGFLNYLILVIGFLKLRIYFRVIGLGDIMVVLYRFFRIFGVVLIRIK